MTVAQGQRRRCATLGRTEEKEIPFSPSDGEKVAAGRMRGRSQLSTLNSQRLLSPITRSLTFNVHPRRFSTLPSSVAGLLRRMDNSEPSTVLNPRRPSHRCTTRASQCRPSLSVFGVRIWTLRAFLLPRETKLELRPHQPATQGDRGAFHRAALCRGKDVRGTTD